MKTEQELTLEERGRLIGWLKNLSIDGVTEKETNYLLSLLTKQEEQHDSDCSVHNEPAMPNGLCDCRLSKGEKSPFAEEFEKLQRPINYKWEDREKEHPQANDAEGLAAEILYRSKRAKSVGHDTGAVIEHETLSKWAAEIQSLKQANKELVAENERLMKIAKTKAAFGNQNF